MVTLARGSTRQQPGSLRHPSRSVGPVITFDPGLVGDYTSLVHKLVIETAVGAFGEDAASALGALRRGEARDLSELNVSHDEFLR